MGNLLGRWYRGSLVRALGWHERARCRQPDASPALFDELGTKPGHDAWLRLAEAKVFCRECPVISECLDWGMDEGSSGIYGGVMLQGGEPRDLTRLSKYRQSAARAKTKKKAS